MSLLIYQNLIISTVFPLYNIINFVNDIFSLNAISKTIILYDSSKQIEIDFLLQHFISKYNYHEWIILEFSDTFILPVNFNVNENSLIITWLKDDQKMIEILDFYYKKFILNRWSRNLVIKSENNNHLLNETVLSELATLNSNIAVILTQQHQIVIVKYTPNGPIILNNTNNNYSDIFFNNFLNITTKNKFYYLLASEPPKSVYISDPHGDNYAMGGTEAYIYTILEYSLNLEFELFLYDYIDFYNDNTEYFKWFCEQFLFKTYVDNSLKKSSKVEKLKHTET